MVVDSEWVYKGVTEWGDVWRRHQWHTATGEVAHGDLWEPFLDLVRERGDLFSIQWVPSHIEIQGNEKAHRLAEEGRVRHWAYSREWVRELQQRLSSEALGLHGLDSEVSESDRSRSSEGQGSDGRRSCGCSTDCTCRSESPARVSETGSQSSSEPSDFSTSTEPPTFKSRRLSS